MTMSHIFTKYVIMRGRSTKLIPILKRVVLALNKKNKIFSKKKFLRKIKGWGKQVIGQNWDIFGCAEISGRWCGRRVQKSADRKFWPCSIATFKDFHFEQKTKKLCNFEVRWCPKVKKSLYPPPLIWNGLYTGFFQAWYVISRWLG